MSNFTSRAFAAFGLFAFVVAGCCQFNDFSCEGTTTITVKATSGNLFPEESFYSIHWTSGEKKRTITSDTAHVFTNNSTELHFVSTSLSNISSMEVEFYVDEEYIAGPETLEFTSQKVGTCDNVDGPSWCEGSTILSRTAELVLDAAVW